MIALCPASPAQIKPPQMILEKNHPANIHPTKSSATGAPEAPKHTPAPLAAPAHHAPCRRRISPTPQNFTNFPGNMLMQITTVDIIRC